MTRTDKIILAFIIVQVAVVLAKPYEPENDDGPYDFFNDTENSVYKRDSTGSFPYLTQMLLKVQQTVMELTSNLWRNMIDCGSGCESGGCFTRLCRSSCRSGEQHNWLYDFRCYGSRKCCMCNGRSQTCPNDK
ncbi:hypothetical protein ACROYT_G029780 [Oculina patagonica]